MSSRPDADAAVSSPAPTRAMMTSVGNAVTPVASVAPDYKTRNDKSEAGNNNTSPAVSSSDLGFLYTFLGLSKEAALKLSKVLTDLGIESPSDLSFVDPQDMEDMSPPISRVLQRKLLCIAVFLRRGGSLEDVASLQELVQSVDANNAAAQKEPSSTSSKPPKDNVDDSDSTIVHLLVGGEKFTTTRKTLCRVGGSVLEAMFSGRHENPAPRMNDDSYVIDRDGTYFGHILNFLRVGVVVTLPSDAAGKEALAIEADYYGLPDLVRGIRMPRIDVAESLSEEILEMRSEEDKLRQAFASKTSTFHAHQGLVPFFCPDDGMQPLPLVYQPDWKNATVCMGDLHKKATPGTPVTVKSLEEFRSNFNRNHPNVLHRLADVLVQEPVIIAGGSVLRAHTSSSGIRTASWWGDKSDIDLFVHCQDPSEANRIAKRIFYALAVDNEQWLINRSRGVITMQNWVNGQIDLKVQIVLRLYESPSEVLVGFDCDCCCCAYDGRAVWVSPRWLHALRNGANILNPLHSWPNKASYELRLAKYAYRGFPVIVPGLDLKRIDMDRIHRTSLRDLKGMSRFLKISFDMDTAKSADRYSLGHQFPKEPKIVQTLTDQVEACYDGSEVLMNCMASGYERPTGTIIPRMYCQDVSMVWFDEVPPAGSIIDNDTDEGGVALTARDQVWREIEDATDSPVDGVPSLLIDSWDTEKRSREYLNASMDKFDLDHIYYSQAYRDEEEVDD